MKPAKKNNNKAVILFSGGLDSTTVLAIAQEAGFACHCLSFSYGQKQSIEVERAKENAIRMNAAAHLVLNLDLGLIGGSALTSDLPVPKDRAAEEMADSIPITYVPGRNTIFLSYGAAWAEVIGARDIFIGVNAVDFSGYPDCRPDYLDAMNRAINLGTKVGREEKTGFTIHAPLLQLSKEEIIRKGLGLGVDYSRTHSCYDPDDKGQACGTCDACQLRLKGFEMAGLEDPAPYVMR